MAKEIIRPSDFCHTKSKAIEHDIELELSPEQQQELASLYGQVADTFQQGKAIEGTVVNISSDGVLVDVGYKSRGLISRSEFNEHEYKELKVDQPIEVILDVLENFEGMVVLSYEKAKAARAWKNITEHFEQGKPIEGVVTHKVKGGLSVDVGIPAFLPGSQVDLQRVSDFDQYVGQTVTAMVLKINQGRGNIIISRRKYLYDQRSEVRKKVLDTIATDQVIQGAVKNITNYGVFIDIGGVDGLLHITDMTWGRISHPSEMVNIGDTVTVKVLSLDKDNEKISLGMKQLIENPWEKVAKTLKVGDKITGKISSITDYGLFVEVADNIEGLVHISEISWTDHITDLSERYKVGDKIQIAVVSLDIENRRMSLSAKQLEENPWDSVKEKFVVGQKIVGKVSNVADFGVFVQLLPGIDGLVHISDLSWTEHIEHPGKRFKPGQEVEAVILAVDTDNKKVSLGIKQLTSDPWEQVDTEYPVGSIVEGTVTKITNFGVFIRLSNGIEGLVHNTTLMNEEGKKAEELFSVGQQRSFRVINVNKAEHKVGLSTKLEGTIAKPHATKEASRDRAAKADSGQRWTGRERRQESATATGPSKVKSALQIALESAMQEEGQSQEESTSDDNKES